MEGRVYRHDRLFPIPRSGLSHGKSGGACAPPCPAKRRAWLWRYGPRGHPRRPHRTRRGRQHACRFAPLKMADDACELDTTHMSIDEVCDVIVSMANEARMKSLDEVRFGNLGSQGQGAQLVHLRCGLLRPSILASLLEDTRCREPRGDWRQPVVYVSNHVSYTRSLRTLVRALRPEASCASSPETPCSGVFAQLIARVGAIPVNPDSADRTAVKRAAACSSSAARASSSTPRARG